MQDVKQAIKKSGLKKQHIAKQIGISPTYLAYMLNGKRDFLDKHKEAILKLVNE